MMSSLVRQSAKKLGSKSSGIQAALYSTAPAVSSSKSNWSFLTGVFGRAPAPLPSLAQPLPGIVVNEATPLTKVESQLTTLDNGFRIISENSNGSTATVGVYISAGSSFETPYSAGVNHLLEKLAFKSTLNRSYFRLVRELESIGAFKEVSTSRDSVSLSLSGIKTYLPEMVEILADSVRNPAFHEWEIHDQINLIKNDISVLASKPEFFIHEALHSTGYSGGLANSAIAPVANLASLTPELLHKYIEAFHTPPRMVLAASGVDHEDLQSLAVPLFEDMPSGDADLASYYPKSEYKGGDSRQASQGEFSHVALGFELPGGWLNIKDSVTATVLQFLMGGGGSFSAGGPGKGMTSRLYRRVLGGSHSEQMESCLFLSNIYDRSGILGVYAAAQHDHVDKLVDTLAEELLILGTRNAITEADLQRAKNAVLSGIVTALESKPVVAEDLGRQILTYGERKPLSEFTSVLNQVQLSDITSLVEKVLKTPLTLVSLGNVGEVPAYDAVAKKFG